MFKPELYSKCKTKIKLSKDGNELRVTFKIYDSFTGEETEETIESVLIPELEAQKAKLQEQIDSINDLIIDLGKLVEIPK